MVCGYRPTHSTLIVQPSLGGAVRALCGVLRRHGIPGAAMPRMLAKVAAATRDPNGELAARIAAARSACAESPVH